MTFSGEGNGTEQSPYVIMDANQLQEMNNNLNAYFVLGDNIDASGTSTWNDNDGFIPIGDFEDRFTGTFNGNGYEITDLTINRSSTNYVGLFGVSEHANILNVQLTNCDISGAFAVGSLIGLMSDTTNVHSCHASGNVSATNQRCGGLIGSAFDNCIIENSSSEVNVVSTSGVVGGFIGLMAVNAITSQCFSTGTVQYGSGYCGGFVGDSSSAVEITDCWTTSNISTSAPSGAFGGGFGGNLVSGIRCFCSNTQTGGISDPFAVGYPWPEPFENCFVNSDLSPMGWPVDGVEEKTTAELQDISTFSHYDIALESEYDGEVWYMPEDSFPRHGWEIEVEEDEEETYTISSITIFRAIVERILSLFRKKKTRLKKVIPLGKQDGKYIFIEIKR